MYDPKIKVEMISGSSTNEYYNNRDWLIEFVHIAWKENSPIVLACNGWGRDSVFVPLPNGVSWEEKPIGPEHQLYLERAIREEYQESRDSTDVLAWACGSGGREAWRSRQQE